MRRPGLRYAGLALAFLLTACGTVPSARSGQETGTAVPLAQASAIADPKSYEGATHAVLGDVALDPISTDARPTLPVTVTDAQGTRVTVKDASRILALDIYGTLSQTVFDLGLGDRVVGRDLSTQFAEAKKLPLVANPTSHDLVAEKILALDPTVILTDTSLGPWDVLLQMRDAGIPVVVVDSTRSIRNITSLTTQVADALGVRDLGVTLAARTMAEVDRTTAEIAKVAPSTVQTKLRTVFLYVRGQAGIYYMFGEGSGADSLIDSLGGYDVSKEIGWNGMKPVTDEGLIAAQPDLILMMTDGLTSVGGVDGLLEKMPALAQTPAGQHQRIVDMTDSAILGFGPRTAQVLNALAVAIYAPGSTKAAS